MKKPETKFKEKVLPRLKALPHSWVLKTHEVARSGIPDILMCLSGIFVAIELKVDSKIHPLQQYNLEQIVKAGGISMVMSPYNIEECMLYLDNFANEAIKYAKQGHVIM